MNHFRYDDLRDQMHPGVAKTVPNTPDAMAILNRNYVKPLAFGGFVTRLVETGAVELGAIEEIRSSVCDMLDIKPLEFDERMADPEPVDEHTVDSWASEYRYKLKSKLIDAATEEATEELSDMLDGAEGKDLSALEKKISEQRAYIEVVQENIQELEAQGRKVPAMTKQIRLDRVLTPALHRLEASSYAIRLPEFLHALRKSTWFNGHGEDFASSVMGNFHSVCDYIKDAAIQEYELQDLFTGTCEDEQTLKIAQETWIPESEMRLLAKAYAESFYGRLPGGEETSWEQQVDALPNPVSSIFFVSEEERDAFFAAFPLSNGNNPR